MATVTEIRDNIISQITAQLQTSAPLLPKAFIRVLASALAGVFVLLEQYNQWVALQLFVSSQSYQESEILDRRLRPLVETGRLIGIGDPTEATQAELDIEVTVITQGYTIPAGEQIVASANGLTYAATASTYLNADVMTIRARAIGDQSGGSGRGTVGNLPIGTEVSFARTVPGIRQQATVTAVPLPAADEETEAAYRQRVLDRFQKRPQGGAFADYEQWAEEVPGILNAYPYTGDNPGEVKIYCEATDTPGGIPTQAQLDAVKANIEYDQAGLATRRPVGALVETVGITRASFDVTVVGLAVANETEVRGQIAEAVEETFLQFEPYITGLTTPPRRDRVSSAAIEGAVLEVVSAAGGVFAAVTVKLSGVDIGVYTLGQGEKAQAGSVTFVPAP